jgi:hypothetical protein
MGSAQVEVSPYFVQLMTYGTISGPSWQQPKTDMLEEASGLNPLFMHSGACHRLGHSHVKAFAGLRSPISQYRQLNIRVMS